MLYGRGMIYITILSLLAPLVTAGVKGFGIIFSVEPMKGSVGGGTEIHVAGAGFAYVTQVLVGGKPCHILEQMTKDGELTAFTPALPAGKYEVEVVFTSGHRAKLRNGKFQTHSRFTPIVNSISQAAAVISNVTWKGDLKKQLEINMNEIFRDTGEKRNATEIMHAYLGTGIEILSDKAGRDEFRCDILDTPTINEGVCEVSAGTPAGYYNFTYVLENGVSMNGYGKSLWEVTGLNPVSLDGQEYAIEVYPTIHSLRTKQVGRMGGAPVYVEADGIFVGKADFAERHQVTLDGVPCIVEDIEDLGTTQVLKCIPGATGSRPTTWPKRLAVGSWAAAWDAAEQLGPFPGRFFPGMVERKVKRAFQVSDHMTYQASAHICSGSRWGLQSTSSLEECAENCFFIGCQFFDFRRESRSCHWCRDVAEDGTMSTYAPSWTWHPQTFGGVYKLHVQLTQYLKDHASVGPNWKLLYGDGRTRCAGDKTYSQDKVMAYRMGGFIQQCADWCSSRDANTNGGNCTYFGILSHHNSGRSSRCVIYTPNTGVNQPENRLMNGEGCTPEVDDWEGHYWTVFELTRERPQSPPPSGIYPGGRGALVRVWNLCPKGNAYNDDCNSRRAGWGALHASLNPDYRNQKPMLEVIRSDVLRGAFGFEHAGVSEPADMVSYQQEGMYKNMMEASGTHGITEEIMAFFVAPFTGYYSFLTWGDQHQDVWLSESNDPADLVKVATRFQHQGCRSGGRRRFVHTGCSMFYNYRSDTRYWDNNWEAHQGSNFSQSFAFSGDGSLGYRTPTEQTIYLKKGERRFFVKRVMLSEDWRPGAYPNGSRRRRRARQFTGLRIQQPDLSEKTAEQQELLSQRKSWPEILVFKKIISKTDGQFRVGLREEATDEPTWSNWITWNFNQDHLTETFNAMVMPSGTQVYTEGWWMDSYGNPSNSDETVTEYMIHIWRPGGNLPPVSIEYDLMRSRVEVNVVSNGNPNDLWLWPLSASLFEVPVLESSVQVAVTGVTAIHSPRVEVESNMSNFTNSNDTSEADSIPFPCVAGQFNAATCSEALGCTFTTPVSGVSTSNILDATQLYDTLEECQQRCCQDEDCFGISYDSATKYCTKHLEFQDHQLETSATGVYSSVESRQPSSDGFASFRGRIVFEGVQVGAYAGHRSVTFCKEKCAAEPLCNSIQYHETIGCFLRSLCVTSSTLRGNIWHSDDSRWTYYKTKGKCTEVWDWTEAERTQAFYPTDLFGSSLSSITNSYPGRRRSRNTRYNLGALVRTPFSTVQAGTRRLELFDLFDESEEGSSLDFRRRLSSLISCEQNCTVYCNSTSDSSDDAGGEDACLSECLSNNCGVTEEANSTMTQTWTSTTTTTLPPPPVRLVQLSGDIFNVGDPLPDSGAVAGRVEIFYNGAWGTVCKDNFGDTEATVVCNELGLIGTFARADESSAVGSPGSESQEILLDEVSCTGTETHLSICASNGWGVHNCFHTEDVKVVCDTSSTTRTTVTVTQATTTTSTTTSFQTVMVTPRAGMLRQDLTGRCVGPASCEEDAALTAEDCKLYLPTASNPQYWIVNTLGQMESAGCPNMCISPSTDSMSWDDRALVIKSCVNTTDLSVELVQQRFFFHSSGSGGLVQNQFSGKCIDTEGSNGRESAVIQWRECDHQAQQWCYKKAMKWEPLNMAGQGRTSVSRVEQCMSRCASVQGCAHFSWWTNGGCHLQDSAAISEMDGNAYSGPPSCAEAVSDQYFAFVELNMSAALTTGVLRNAESKLCFDPQGLDNTVLQVNDCQTQTPNGDQYFNLLSDGTLKNVLSGLCVNITEPTDGTNPSVFISECVNVASFKLDNSSRLVTNGRCVSSGTTTGDAIVTVTCPSVASATNMSLSWEFVETTMVAARCHELCTAVTGVWDIWILQSHDLSTCECGHLFREDYRWNYIQEGVMGSSEIESDDRWGLVMPPNVAQIKLHYPSSILSSVSSAFQPGVAEMDYNNSMGVGLFSPDVTLPRELPESGDEPETPFGFSYLNEADTPYVDRISVNGTTVWVNNTVQMTEGDMVVITGRNFHGLMDAEVKVHLGLVVVPSVTVTATSISFTAPLTTFGPIVMQIMVGWKGWADFAPFLELESPLQQDNIIIQFDELNELTAVMPSIGSMVGGAQVTITGRGFQLPGLTNVVELYHHGGDLMGQMAGVCNVSSGSLTSISCQMPTFDLSHWSSTQFEERMELRVNGQRYVTGSTPLLFTYSRPSTPIVLETIPESLSFALTNNITVVGFNFGLLKREVQVMFGNRTCKIWDVNQTHINCQLKRSAMALPPLCTANRDIYNEDCVVKPHNFFQKPILLVTSRGYGVSRNSSFLDTRFEIHNVEPKVGSEEGGALVTVTGVGFGNKQLTPQLTIAALGTLGDVVSWSDTQVVFTTRKLTLNVAKVDLMVNLISAKHKCGSGPDPHPGTTTTTTIGQNISLDVAPVVEVITSEDCEHRAFRAYVTPNVTAVSALSGNDGDTITFTVSMPDGYIAAVSNASVSVHLGPYVCPHTVDSKSGNTLTISCTVPAFEASTVMIKVRILPLGYARMGDGLEKFTQSLTVDSITPNSGSKGGMKVMIAGKGFSTTAKRHFVRVGSEWFGTCEPLSSTYSSLSCFLNYKDVNQGSVSGGSQQVEVMLWDTEVSADALSAFGNSQTGCLRGENDWRRYNVASQEECALHCLTTSGCKSFDYSARYQRCFMSDTSFTSKSDAEDQRQSHCRYFERRSEETPTVMVSVTKDNFFTFSDSNTPSINLIYALPTSDSPLLQGTAVGCSSSAADLTSGNSGCCSTETPCGVNEGVCSSDSRCAGDLQCISYSCSWTSTATDMQDACCVLQGENGAFVTQDPLWAPDDRIYVRVSSLGDAESAVTSDPSGGAVNVSFNGVRCPIDTVRSFSGESWIDLGCNLGAVPGGLAAFPSVETAQGVALDQSTWIFTSLNISGAEPVDDSMLATSSSLGGGWLLNVTGEGFAPPKGQGADTYVEVTVCGRPCEVVQSTPNSLECIVPNVTTPEVLNAAADAAIVLPAARVLTRNAGTISDAPLCFHGVGEQHYEVGHSTCVAVFDDDPEVVAGTSGSNCHLGVDFGPFTNARVEKIRWHPLYDFLEADSYINSKFQIGSLAEPQTCDELSYGWRGVAYQGCQAVSEGGNPCKSWTDSGYDFGHSYCRNPLPGSRPRGIWCYLQRGGWEYCNPKVPEITWTDVYTLQDTPKMLWNDIVLTTAVVGRFVRFLSPVGNCQMQEMQVVGQLVAPTETCEVAVRNVHSMTGPNLHMNLGRLAWRGGIHHYEEFPQAMSEWVSSVDATITFSVNKTPTVTHISPMNGTARGGTSVTLYGTNFGPAWMADPDEPNATTPVTVDFNGYECSVQQVTASSVVCVTVPRSDGIKLPSMTVTVEGAGNAWIKPGTRYRYLDRWSLLDTWANQEPPIEDALVSIPQGQAILLDEDTPILLILTVEGVLVFDNKDIHLQATYIWVKGGTMEIGTEQKPFLHRALITLHGQKYETIRLPVIGGKVLAVSNTQFTIRELGDNAVEEGSIGTLDIHGRPRLKVWTRLAQTANAGDNVIVLQEVVDWQVGEELMVAATDIPHKHFDGNGLHGAPPMDFHNERVFVQSVAADMKTITLTAPLKFTHISTYFIRPLDDEYIDLSAEVALLSRNVKIQGEAYHSERDQWGGHTMVAFGGIYRLENAEFFRLGQTGEVSRYPIHFHITQDYGQNCYARYNSIHHSFQRAVAIHSTSYVNVKGNVAFDIIGHMFFIETGMEMHNVLEGNLGVGAIPLLSGMLESDQEPAGFWTAAPNNVWRDNVAVTGSDGWYFQLPGTPISHNIDIYKDSICPVGSRIGEWRRNRCHHLPGSCIRIYLTWIPRKEPCNADSAEDPQILFNTTCWGIGKACYNAMKMGSVHNHHMTAVEGGAQDYESIKFIRAAAVTHGNKFETDFVNIPHIKDSVFVRILPQNLGLKSSSMGMSVQLPQNEQFLVADSMWINTGETPVFKGCAKCWSFAKWRQGAHTYRSTGLSFVNVTRRINIFKKDIYWDLDGSLTGTANSYTSWADSFNYGHPDCVYTQVIFNTSDDGTQMESTWYSNTGTSTDSPSIFKSSPNNYQHEVRNHTFMTCTTPIRKFGIAWPEPQEVHLRQLTITNLDTGYFSQHEFEKLELFGWGFPVVANQRLEVRPNFLGMDLTEGGIQYGFNDLLASKASEAIRNLQTATPEWLQLQLKFWMNYNHVKLTNPYSWWVGTRYGEAPELRSVQAEEKKPYLTEPTPLDTPESLPSMTHGMKDQTTWAMNFRYPKPADAPAWENVPYGAHFQARKCPDEGCILNLPARNQNWTNYTLWSAKFGDVTGQAVEIDSADWIVFDLDFVALKNLTIKGKLSFDDSQDRVLRTGNILVWGVLEIGNSTSPWGETTGKTCRVELTGNVLDLADYMYIQEQSLWGKVITVIGQVNTFGATVSSTWLRLKSSIGASEESACVMSSTDPSWKTGHQVAFSVTEFDNPWARTMQRTLTSDAVYESANDCWRFSWSGNLAETRYAGDVDVGSTNVSLRAVVARVDRSVVFTSEAIDTTGGSAYGGHIEIIDLTLDDVDSTKWVGTVDMSYTHFDTLGKGALSAAVKVTYSSNFEPPPVIAFHGCSWTNSQEYALHLESSNVPTLITNNVMVKSLNGGIFLQTGSSVHIKDNAILGVTLADTAPRAIAQDDSQVIVMQYAGIRADELPVRMIGNVVAGSNDIGYLHPAETCPPRGIFNNEATGTVTGVYLLTQKSATCQTINLYTIWKAAHVALFLSDVMTPQTQLANIVIADSHIGMIPYMSIGSAFRRLFVRNCTFIGTSPAGTDCSRSVQCRTQTLTDPYMETCSSMYQGAGFRRVGFATPIQTVNKKTCWATKPAYECRLMSPAMPTLNDCHQPWEKDIHMQKGLGWTFFEDTTFAYFKSSDCGMTDRAIAPNMWGAEVNFPATFTRTTWHETDMNARYELSTEYLDDAYGGRASPCKSTGGGCMGLDQLLLQDTDGTLTGMEASPMAVVLPLTPRTEIVWAPLCNTTVNDVAMGAQVCPNTVVDLLEMNNLDRGAKDIKFGPLVMTPDVPEDNGFQGGVLSSVGPFYASCPCGWDFSFYHILIKPNTTYYTEVMSLPENFRLRYWSPRPDDKVLLEIFYPDSRGVNVFVGGEKEPQMLLRLGRKPTYADPHGSHVVDAQALRLYIVLWGSVEGFNARKDLVVRRTPTVKLKMNIEISITEFNADQFQTNLAILLGIPPERIVVAAVSARRRLALLDAFEESDSGDDIDMLTGMPCRPGELCQTPRRRLTVNSQTALDVSISPSTDAAAAASGGDSESTGADALNAQTNELTEVSNTIAGLSTSPELAAAVGAEVSVSDIQPPATVDEGSNEAVPSASETAEVEVVDITAVASTSASAEVSAEAPCLTAFGVTVTVGTTTGIVYLTSDLANAGTTTSDCSGVDSGYQGSITLSCSAGTLKANSASCTPKSCTTSDSVSVTIGSTTSSVSPTSDLASGIVATKACADVDSSYTGNFELYCNGGVLTYDVTSCSPGCATSDSITLTVAGSTSSWSPSATMTSGQSETTTCEPINSGYTGTISISCFFGVLSANPAGCVAKPCAAGSTISVTLDGVTNTLTTGSEIRSGFTTSASCTDVNNAWGSDLTLRCTMGTLSADTSTCQKACASSDSVDLTLGNSTTSISPSNTIASGSAEYNKPCSDINSGFTGTYTLSCTTGTLSGELLLCAESGCTESQTVLVTVGDTSTTVAAGEALDHGGSTTSLCETVNSVYTGTLQINCEYGAVSLATSSCEITPCEPWHFVAATLHGTSGLLYPRATIASGASGVGECGNVNVEYSGDFTMSCVNGQLQADSGDECKRTCSTTSVTQLTLDGFTYDVSPANRVAHLGTGVQACGNVRYGYGGEVQLACNDGTLSVTSHACIPEPCPVGLLIQTTIYGRQGIGAAITNASHLAVAQVECNSINPETVGIFEATCIAKSLFLVNETACSRSCTSDSVVDHQLDGYTYSVAPVGMIVHNTTATQNCSDFSSGYSGTIDVKCMDNVSTVVSHACVANPCPDPRTNEATTVEANSQYTQACSTISDLLVGDVTYSCIGGSIRTNTSACNAPCNETSNATLHGAAVNVACSGFLGSAYDGQVVMTCNDGTYNADSTACTRACLVGEFDTVVVNGNSHSDATVTERLSSGSSETLQCNTLDSEYEGTFVLTCTNGVLSDQSSCNEMCVTSDSVSATILGTSYTLQPVDNIGHGEVGNVPCANHITGYTGNIALSCNEGVLQATPACEAPCASGSTATVTFGGASHTVTLTSQILSGSTGTESCSAADNGFTGNLVMSCSDGTLSFASDTCAERSCAQDLSYDVTVGGVTKTLILANQVAHAGTYTVECGSIAEGWGGDLTVTCLKGALVPDTSTCLSVCVSGLTTSLVMGVDGHSFSVTSDAIDHSATRTQSCTTASEGFSGDMVLSCSNGVVTLDSNTCVELPCTEGLSYTGTAGSSTATLQLASQLQHNENLTLTCATVDASYDRDFTMKCQRAQMVDLSSNCLQACTTDTIGPVQLGAEHLEVSPVSRMTGDGTSFEKNCSDLGMVHQGTMTATCNAGQLTIDHRCIVGCALGVSAQVTLDAREFPFTFEYNSMDQETSTQECPPGWSSNMSIKCVSGFAELLSHTCEPLPCPNGTIFDFNVDYVTKVGFVAHDQSYTEQCEDALFGFLGTFQATCKYGNMTGDTSTCIGQPCPAGTMLDVTVGWQNASQQYPSGAQIDHGTKWTVACSSINSEFSGMVDMQCYGTEFRFDASNCVQIEVGCLPTGRGQDITVGNDTATLLPTLGVQSGESFAVDCGAITENNYVGTVSATCGNLGSYTGLEINCLPRSCVAGEVVDVAKGTLSGQVTVSKDLAHYAVETTTCESVDEAMRGVLRLTCQFGSVVPDTSNCAVVCLPSRPGQVIFGNQVVDVTSPTEVDDGRGYFTECNSLYTGFTGTAQVTCNGGTLVADVSKCEGLPCESGNVTQVQLYDVTKAVAITQDLIHGASESFECSTVNPDYAGTFKVNCFADAVAPDVAGCTCQADGCSTAPCSATQTFFVNLTGITETRAVGKQLGSLETTNFTCNSVVEGHDGTMVVTCNAGVLVPDTSLCTPKGCSPGSTPSVEVVIGGASLEVAAPKDMVHNEVYHPDSCANISSGYEGEVKVTCFLGALVYDGTSCSPLPCQDEVRDISVGGFDLTVRLNGTKLGTTSPAPSGFQVSGLSCSQLDENLLGTFIVGCTASVYSLDLTSCVLKSCEPPISATAGLGTDTQSGALRLGEQFEHDCESTTGPGQNCTIGCSLGWEGIDQPWQCWQGDLSGNLPNCTKLPVYASIKGKLNLEVSNPEEFVSDPNAKKGIAIGIAEMCQVNESEVNVTLQVVNTSEVTTTTGLPDRRLDGSNGFFLEALARRLQDLVVQVDYTVNTEVADQSEAVSRGVELVAAISAPSDEQFASTITQAITEASGGTSSYAVVVTEREATIQVVIGDEVFSPEELDFNMTNFTTTTEFVAVPEPWDATPLIVTLVVVSIIGLCVGAVFVQWFVNRKAKKQHRAIFRSFMGGAPAADDDEGAGPDAPDVEIPEFSPRDSASATSEPSGSVPSEQHGPTRYVSENVPAEGNLAAQDHQDPSMITHI